MLISPKNELFRWGPIPFKVFYGSFFNEAFWLYVHKHYPWPWFPCVALYQKGKAEYIADYSVVRRVGAKYFRRYFLNRKNFRAEWQKWQQWVRRWRAFARRFDRVQWRKISDADLHGWVQTFYRLNIDFLLSCHVPEIANWGGEHLLRRALKRIDRKRADGYLEILAAPTRFSFFQEEERALLKLALAHDKGRGGGGTQIQRHAFKEHAQKWSWMLNSYGGNRVLTVSYFTKKLHDLLAKGSALMQIRAIAAQRRSAIERKRVLARQLRAPSLLHMGELLAYSIWWQDVRKSYVWRLNAAWDIVLHEVARRSGWSFEELLWCWPKEIIAIIKPETKSHTERLSLEKKRILQRRVLYATFQRKGLLQHFYGRGAQKLVNRFTVRVASAAKVLRGLVVSRGTGNAVRGRVVIIRDALREVKKMRTGDILVAPMTSPEFIVVMKKAAAIVTDHGGMTSHAAVVSRELGISCIVGTKIATHVLNDGDRVEVDATKGIVRKL